MKSIIFNLVGTLLVSSVLCAPQTFNTDIGNKGGAHDTKNINNVSPGTPPSATGGPVSGPVPTKPGASLDSQVPVGNQNVPNIPNILAKSQAQVQKSQALIEKMGLNKVAPTTPPKGGENVPNHPPQVPAPTGSGAGAEPSFTSDVGNVDGLHKTTNNNNAPSSSGGVPQVAPEGPAPSPKGPTVDPIPPISPNPSASSGGDFNSDVGNIEGDHKTMNKNNAGGSGSGPVEPIQDPIPPISPNPSAAPKDGATFNTDIGNQGGDHKTENNNNV